MVVRDFMSSPCSSVDDNTSVFAVAQLMRDKRESSVVVLDDDLRPIGIATVNDIIVKVVAEGKDPSKVEIKDVMNEVRSVDINVGIDEAFRELTNNGFLSCPVTEEGVYKGTLHLHEAASGFYRKSKGGE